MSSHTFSVPQTSTQFLKQSLKQTLNQNLRQKTKLLQLIYHPQNFHQKNKLLRLDQGHAKDKETPLHRYLNILRQLLIATVL